MKLKDAKKERRIMDVTIDIVAEKGMAGVKMSEVAKRVKISPSNLYIYFKNKEDLLQSIFFDSIMQVTRELKANLPTDAPFKKRFFIFYSTVLDRKTNRIKEFSFFKQFVQSPFFSGKFYEKMDLMVNDFLGLFREGQEEMILKDDVQVELMFALFSGMTDMLVEFDSKGKIQLNQKTIEKSFALVWDALRQ